MEAGGSERTGPALGAGSALGARVETVVTGVALGSSVKFTRAAVGVVRADPAQPSKNSESHAARTAHI